MSKVLPLLACLLLAAPLLYADEPEDKAVAALLKVGGRVDRDDKDPAHPVVGVDFSSLVPFVTGRGSGRLYCSL